MSEAAYIQGDELRSTGDSLTEKPGNVESADLVDSAAVKVTWREEDGGWKASLLAVDEDGFTALPLDRDLEINLELTSSRRCVGYHADVSSREPCPEFRFIDEGSQCRFCRRRDVYAGYVEGRSEADVSGDVEFSVYLARLADVLKVGVTRTEKVLRRWVEQGADEAVELRSSLSSVEALELESEISRDQGVRERVRKEEKRGRVNRTSLEEMLEELDVEVEGSVVDVAEKTVYPPPNCTAFSREGRFTGTVESVKGQVVCFTGGRCVAVASGRVFTGLKQRGLMEY